MTYGRHDEHHEGIPVLETILIELRELRTDFNNNARHSGERFAALETHLNSVVGNGQPGRLTLVEQSCKELSAWRWKMVGITTGASAVISTIAALLLHLT